MFVLLSLLSLVSAQANYSQPGDAVECKDVHVFLARGNNEPYPGRQGKLVEAICDGISSCSYEDVQFYNPYEASYAASVQEGAVNGVKQLTAFVDACPKSQVVLSGYSQGANVIGDVLGGGYGVFFHNYTEDRVYGIDAKVGGHIKAVVLFGDTRHTPGQSYNVESGAEGTGLFPRPADLLQSLNQYAGVLRSYCVKTDPICAPDIGPEDVESHLNYFDVFSDSAATWIKSMLDIDETKATSTTQNSKPTATNSESSSTNPVSTNDDNTATSTGSFSTSTASPESTSTDTSAAGLRRGSGFLAVAVAGAVACFLMSLSLPV